MEFRIVFKQGGDGLSTGYYTEKSKKWHLLGKWEIALFREGKVSQFANLFDARTAIEKVYGGGLIPLEIAEPDIETVREWSDDAESWVVPDWVHDIIEDEARTEAAINDTPTN